MPDNKPKIRITRKEKKTGMIDRSKLAPMKTTVVNKNKPGASTKSTVHMGFERGKTTKTYTPGDVRTSHPGYGKERSGGEAPGFIKSAQAEKKDIVMKDGKPYRAGYTEETKTPDKATVKIRINPNIKMHKHSGGQSIIEPSDDPKGGKRPGKRRLEHVPYLEKVKRNKRTESGHGR